MTNTNPRWPLVIPARSEASTWCAAIQSPLVVGRDAMRCRTTDGSKCARRNYSSDSRNSPGRGLAESNGTAGNSWLRGSDQPGWIEVSGPGGGEGRDGGIDGRMDLEHPVESGDPEELQDAVAIGHDRQPDVCVGGRGARCDERAEPCRVEETHVGQVDDHGRTPGS